jgi:hypothetical protein
MVKDKKDVTIRILFFGLILLTIVLLYILIFKPMINSYKTKNYNQAYSQGQIDLVSAMILQIQNQGFVNIPLNQNQSIVLIPYVPQQNTQS